VEKGILVAADQKEEWLLSWWWSSYALYNDFPVTFIDWGMSEEAKSWCQKRGKLVSLPISPSLFEREHVAQPILSVIEEDGEELWKIRPFWFSKPLALLASPYEYTAWIDLDCEILTPVDPLFEYADPVAIARETERSRLREEGRGILLKGQPLYNSGVIVYKKKTALIERWAEICLEKHASFFGDQDALSYLIANERFDFVELPAIFNWRMSQGLHFDARIIHWAGSWGKAFIKKHGGLREFARRRS
jgi:hypothetical protein